MKRPETVCVRFSKEELAALKRRRQKGETISECVRRLVVSSDAQRATSGSET